MKFIVLKYYVGTHNYYDYDYQVQHNAILKKKFKLTIMLIAAFRNVENKYTFTDELVKLVEQNLFAFK